MDENKGVPAMQAVTVVPGKKGSALLEDIAEPAAETAMLSVGTIAVGVCGTDLEILKGDYGEAPPGRERLILGHESLGRVLEAPPGSGFSRDDLVAAVVRRPDPVPCPNCAVGEWDMCRNGRYTERGIKGLHGFMCDRFRLEPKYAVRIPASLARVGMLVEPASVVAKAWEVLERIGSRARWLPRKILVTGAGPIGLLAALMGVQRDLDVHVLDRVTDGPKPALVRDLGATYHTGTVEEACTGADVVIECTGVGQLVFDAAAHLAPAGIVCLTGVSSGGRTLAVDAGAINRSMVLENHVIVGSVNANRRHWDAAVKSLARADGAWLERLITRRVSLDHWADAFERRPHDVKTVLQFSA
jgi:threonine dehydrogenase-like Zn-dependent dehydrogenase